MQQVIFQTFERVKQVPDHIWILLVATITYIIYRGATIREAILMFASSFLLGPFIGGLINKLLVQLNFETGASALSYTFAAVLSYNVLEHLIKQSPKLSEGLFRKITNGITTK